MKFTIEMNIHELSRSIAAGTLESLVSDIKSHENQVRAGKTAAPTPTPAAASEPAPDPPAAVTPLPEPVTNTDAPPWDSSEITEVQIRAKFVELNKKGKKKELKALLDKFGVAKVSDLKPEHYQEAWAGLEAL